MDYTTFYNAAASQSYPFMGIPPTSPFTHTGVDPETILSVEPLDGSYLPTYPFHAQLPTTQGSPEAGVPPTPMPIGSVDSGFGGEGEENRASRTRSSSEEKENGLTPAQSRRKAQNRAAQRAFRERKERHVKELEAKLTALESSTQNLQSDNERLKLALQRAKTENEILRATSGAHSPTASTSISASYPTPLGVVPDESEHEKYNVQSLTHATVLNSTDNRHSRSQGGREVPPHQVWDLIQSHPMVKQGLVDITDVCERLKGLAKCSGHGPIFEEQVIWRAVEESRRSGGDELI